ncbi:MAG TPA: prepilin peptidase [Alphaproteobacteria bacterium]|nr:prepilin peptidase [Alphaproteobacteria bacterium]
MASAFINHVTIIMFAGLLAWAAVSDFRTYLIPNSVSISVAVLYPAHVLASPLPVDWPGALIVAVLMLAAGFVLFALRYAGGGDAKLLAAASLWAGPDQILAFLLLTTLAGGMLALVTGNYLRFMRPWPDGALAPDEAAAVKLQTSVPYGIAVALGGLWVAFQIMPR